MSSNQTNLFSNKSLNVIIKTITDDNNVLWFKAKDIALFLGYVNAKQAIRHNIDNDYKTVLDNIEASNRGLYHSPLTVNAKNTVYINEPGLYQLIFASKLETAKTFQQFIINKLPILRTQKLIADTPRLIGNQFVIKNEMDLHQKVVSYIRKYYPDVMINASLGENQDSSEKKDNIL